ncbi:MAG TPA: MFS transporter [Chloroflexia bacterium]|nr:MFS transporter [Chloroflexia bacterium]
MRPPAPGLWQNPAFRRLWAGQSVSQLGSQITLLALPLTAVLALGATPVQMGILGAAEAAPWMLFGLFAGAWVDRVRRRPVLIGADLGRAALLASVPLAADWHLLGMEWLYAVGFLAGALNVLFEVAHGAFLPTVVPRSDLMAGNSTLQASISVAEVAGPGLAGALVQALSAPVAIVLDAVSFLVSAVFVSLIRTPEAAPAPGKGRNMVREVREGLGVVRGSPILRWLVLFGISSNLFFAMNQAVRVLYVSRDLHLAPALVGAIFAAGSVGGLPAALLAGRMARRFGIGRTLVTAQTLICLGAVLFPLAEEPRLAALLLVAGMILSGLGAIIYIITVGSLRQATTPDRLQGRVSASMRFISRSAVPLGMLIGGLLGEQLGLRTTLIVAAVGTVAGPVLVLLSPVARLHELPAGEV